MSITDELIEVLDKILKSECAILDAIKGDAQATLAKARALQQAPPTTAIGWLELARDAGLPWAESALRQRRKDLGQCSAATLYEALMGFRVWSETKEGVIFWADLCDEIESLSVVQLREMARARKEAQ